VDRGPEKIELLCVLFVDESSRRIDFCGNNGGVVKEWTAAGSEEG